MTLSLISRDFVELFFLHPHVSAAYMQEVYIAHFKDIAKIMTITLDTHTHTHIYIYIYMLYNCGMIFLYYHFSLVIFYHSV